MEFPESQNFICVKNIVPFENGFFIYNSNEISMDLLFEKYKLFFDYLDSCDKNLLNNSDVNDRYVSLFRTIWW